MTAHFRTFRLLLLEMFFLFMLLGPKELGRLDASEPTWDSGMSGSSWDSPSTWATPMFGSEGSSELNEPPVPVVSLRVRVPARVVGGQEIEYRLCVENRSAADAHHVLVRNPLPANARFVRANPEPTARDPELRWQLGTLKAKTKREIVLVLAAKGADAVENCARVQFEHGQCVTTQISQPRLQLEIAGPERAVLKDTLTYRATVSNNGTAEAAGVILTATVPPGLEVLEAKSPLTWDFGNLAPGQSQSVEYQVIAKEQGKHCSRLRVTAAGGWKAEKEICVLVGEAKMTLDKTGPAQRYLNLPATYRFTLTNTGVVPLANVAIVDPLPEKTEFVSASEGGKLADNEVRWEVGSVEPGASRIAELVLKAQTAGRICNKASATADRGLTAQAELCTEFVGHSALLLEMVDTRDPVEVGSETSYVILVRNQGTAPATGVRIEALAPTELEITRATGPADNRKDGQLLVFEPITIQPKTDARFEVHVKAIRAGDVRFKVELRADMLTSGPVHEEESTTLFDDITSKTGTIESDRRLADFRFFSTTRCCQCRKMVY